MNTKRFPLWALSAPAVLAVGAWATTQDWSPSKSRSVGASALPTAAASCAAEEALARTTGDAVRIHYPLIASESELYPLQGDDGAKVVVILQQRSAYSPELEWSDDLANPKLYPADTYRDGMTWRNADSYDIRTRRATVGDILHRDLMRRHSDATEANDQCIKRACEPRASELAKAVRLHDLHSSEATARELVAAESAFTKCKAVSP